MKVKRQRQTRRHLRFLRTAFGFHEPYKVLCDGNFLHHATTLKLTSPDVSLPKLLGAPTKAYTTRFSTCLVPAPIEAPSLGLEVLALRSVLF